MDVASGVVAFVSITGQVLQGFNYLCTVFSDATEAPEVVALVFDELQATRESLLHFRATLTELERRPGLIPKNWNPTSTLKCCQTAVARLQDFVKGFPELRPQNVSVISTSAKASMQNNWQKFKLANNTEKLRKHISRLRSAKQGLELLQSNLGAQIGLASHVSLVQQFEDISCAPQSLASLAENSAQNLDTSAATLRAVRHLETISHETQDDMADLKSMSKHFDDFSAVSNNAQTGALDLLMELSRHFKSLPGVLSSMVEASVTRALTQHTARMTTEAETQQIARVTEKLEINEIKERGEGDKLFKRRSCSCLETLEQISSRKVNDGHFRRQNLVWKSPRRQRRSETSYSAWFGRIVITITITEQEDLFLAGCDGKYHLSAKQTMITLLPNLRFSTWGAVFQIGTNRPSYSHPLWDNRLRVFRTHPWGSAVSRVLDNGDYLEFRKMLNRREVTPFDRISSYSSSLFEEAILALADENDLSMEKTQGLFNIAKTLADQGVDCGLGDSMYHIQNLAHTQELADTVALDLYRITVSHAETNPFEQNSNCAHKWEIRYFLTQEDWDLSTAQEEFEKYYGKGSWNCVVVDRTLIDDWKSTQIDTWARKTRELRRSEAYCLAEFGFSFVNYKWPKLLWHDQRPPFWRSRERCRQTFSDYFVGFKWPQLYWEEEVPTFWFSPQECKKVFGKNFQNREWATMLGQSCFEHVFGRGAWLDFKLKDRYRFTEWQSENWLPASIQRWQAHEQAIRHSRSALILEFGIEFVKEHLPALLKADSMPDYEIEELTHDGSDMYCRPPQWPRQNKEESWDEEDEETIHAKEARSNISEDRHGNEENDVDSDCDGWETADERDSSKV